MNLRAVLLSFCCILFTWTGLVAQTQPTVNSRTKPTSGDWQEPYWSLGHLPSFEDGAVMLTNSGWKAVAIQSSTTGNYPGSLRLRSLTVDAEADSRNLLLLNYAGLTTALNPVNDFNIGRYGSLISYYSAIDGGTFTVAGGSAMFGELAQTRFWNVAMTNGGELVLSNSWFEANETIVSGTNTTTIRQYGGTNRVGALRLNSNARYYLSGGTLSATNLSIWWGLPNAGESPFLVQSGGNAQITQLYLDNGAVYQLMSGNLAAKSISIGAARVELSGGTVLSNETVSTRWGGTLSVVADGEYNLGHFLSGGGNLDFGAGRKILRFTGAGYPPPLLDGSLNIKNWTGPVSSPNRDRLYFGNNADGGGYQTQITYFVDPEGYPHGTYRAVAKVDGEIVPLEPVRLKYTRSGNTLIFTWPAEFELWAGTNVTGPYDMFVSATSPHTVSFSGSRRFFILYPKW